MRLFAVVFLLAVASSAHAAPTRSPSRVAQDVHTRGHYPSDLSVLPPPRASGSGAGAGGGGLSSETRPRLPVRLYRSGGENTPPDAPDPNMRIPNLGLFGEILGWLLVGVCVLLLVVALGYGVMQLRFSRGKRDAEQPPERKPAGEGALDPLLVMPELSAEELARLGRHREAIHALLVSGLLATGFRPEGRARGSTAREVVSALAGGDRRKAPLDALLGITELVWFGGREATLERFERARAMHADVVRGSER